MPDAGERVSAYDASRNAATDRRFVIETLRQELADERQWRSITQRELVEARNALSAAEAENARMREALVKLVGSRDLVELAQMKAVLSGVPHRADRAAILFAIETLIAALSGQEGA